MINTLLLIGLVIVTLAIGFIAGYRHAYNEVGQVIKEENEKLLEDIKKKYSYYDWDVFDPDFFSG
jgi:hypothetical protein